jgi:DNA-binding NarL/FixJ family response regulator
MYMPSALIVDQDTSLCRWLTQTLTSWSLSAKNLANPRDALHDMQQHTYNLILVDVGMPDVQQSNLFQQIGSLCPQAKIISLLPCVEPPLISKALDGGTFDFLEKPIALDLLRHVVMRALEMQRLEDERIALREEIARNYQTLTDLGEALTTMTKTVDMIRHVTKTHMVQQMKSLILPLLENLRQDRQLQGYESSLSQLAALIDDIHTGTAEGLRATTLLSAREIRTALMIKNGMTNQEIASQLHIALETVKAHRRNIRKKLGITGTKCTLSSYLQSLQDDETL